MSQQFVDSRAMTEVIFEDGETGHVEFDSHGDRVGALYDIVNVQPHSDCGVSKPSCRPVINTVGKYVQVSRFFAKSSTTHSILVAII